MIAVFTGTRNGSVDGSRATRECLEGLVGLFGDELTVLVGDCITGIDESVRRGCQTLGIDYAVFHANWTFYRNRRESAGPRRNSAMIQLAEAVQDAGGHVGLFYFSPDGTSRGTADCVRRAMRAKITCRRIGGLGVDLS